MHLASQPRTPSPHVFIQVASPTIPAAWRQYLARLTGDSRTAVVRTSHAGRTSPRVTIGRFDKLA